jgi:hypothetical protein
MGEPDTGNVDRKHHDDCPPDVEQKMYERLDEAGRAMRDTGKVDEAPPGVADVEALHDALNTRRRTMSECPECGQRTIVPSQPFVVSGWTQLGPERRVSIQRHQRGSDRHWLWLTVQEAEALRDSLDKIIQQVAQHEEKNDG